MAHVSWRGPLPQANHKSVPGPRVTQMVEEIYGPNLTSRNPVKAGAARGRPESAPSRVSLGASVFLEGSGLACLLFFIAGRETGNLLLYKSYHSQHK